MTVKTLLRSTLALALVSTILVPKAEARVSLGEAIGIGIVGGILGAAIYDHLTDDDRYEADQEREALLNGPGYDNYDNDDTFSPHRWGRSSGFYGEMRMINPTGYAVLMVGGRRQILRCKEFESVTYRNGRVVEVRVQQFCNHRDRWMSRRELGRRLGYDVRVDYRQGYRDFQHYHGGHHYYRQHYRNHDRFTAPDSWRRRSSTHGNWRDDRGPRRQRHDRNRRHDRDERRDDRRDDRDDRRDRHDGDRYRFGTGN